MLFRIWEFAFQICCFGMTFFRFRKSEFRFRICCETIFRIVIHKIIKIQRWIFSQINSEIEHSIFEIIHPPVLQAKIHRRQAASSRIHNKNDKFFHFEFDSCGYGIQNQSLWQPISFVWFLFCPMDWVLRGYACFVSGCYWYCAPGYNCCCLVGYCNCCGTNHYKTFYRLCHVKLYHNQDKLFLHSLL